MSVLKLSKKDITVNNSDDSKIKLKKGQVSFDSAMLSGWETTNKESYNTINTINEKLKNNEFLTADDIASYRTATDNYINSTNKLRGVNKIFGKGYTDDEEKSWTDYSTNAMSNIDSMAEFYSSFKSEEDYTKYKNYNDSYTSYKEAAKNDSTVGMSGYDKFIKDREAVTQKNVDGERDINGDGKVAWWEHGLYYLSGGNGGGVVDTTLPTHLTTQTINDIRAYGIPLDTSTWDDEQKALFGYIYESDPSKAMAIGDYINNLNHDNAIQEIFNSAANNYKPDTFGAILGSLTGIVDYLQDLTVGNATGEFKTSGTITPFEYSQAVIGGNAQYLNNLGTLNEDVPIIGGKGLGDVYQLGTSILQSALAGTIGGGWGSLILLGGSAAASGVDDAMKRGATEGQAIVVGGLAGLAEGIAEKMGMDTLVDNVFKKGSTTALKAILKQSISEGAEEGVTSIANGFIDNLVMGDKSNFNTLVEEYISKGMSESEAKKKAWLQYAEDIAYDMIGGAVSGGLHAGGALGVNTAINSYNANKVYGGSQQELINEGLEFAEGTKQNSLAKKYQDKLNGKKLSGYQLSKLSQTIQEGLIEQDTGKIKSATEARLKELGETSNTSELAETLTKWVKGEELTKKEKNLVKNSKYGRRVANELNPDNIKSGGYTSDWTGSIGTEKINSDLYNLAQEVAGVKSNTESYLSPSEIEKRASVAMEEFNAANSSYRSRLETERANLFQTEQSSSTIETTPTQAYTVSTEGKTVRESDGQEINIKDIYSNNNGQLKLITDDGEVVDAKDVSFKSKEEAWLYKMVADLGVGVDTAKSMMDIFGQDNTSIESYRVDAPHAYKYGLMNYVKGLEKLDLSQEQKTRLFGLGRTDAGHNAKASVEANKNKTVSNATTNKGKIIKNGIIYESKEAANDKRADIQNASVKVAEFIDKASNLEVHLYKSFKENGKIYAIIDGEKRVAQNGYFTNGNQIYLDINAGATQQGVMLYTMSHEVGHYIREWNAEEFKALGDFIFEHYDNTDKVNEEINRQIEKIKARLKADNQPIPSEIKLFDMAYEEVVCDALSKMFADPTTFNIFAAELKAQNKTLWQKLGEAIKNFLDKVKDLLKVYSKQNPDAPSGRWVDTFEKETYKQLQKMYVKAFVNADKNFELAKVDTAETTTEHNDYKFQLRETFEETKELVAVHNMTQEQLQKSLELGGLPMPSIAIIKAKDGHSEYGDVSLVFQKDTIDPEANTDNKVYGGDAWTPVYPKIEFKPNEKVEAKIREKYYSLAKKFSYDEARPLYNYANNLEDTLNSYKSEEAIIERLLDDTDMMQLYLLDIGKDKIETVQKETRTELSDAEVQQHEFFIKELGESVIDEIKAPEGVSPFNHRKEYLAKHGTQIEQTYRKLMTDVYKFSAEEVQNVIDQETDYTLLKKIRDAYSYRQKGRVTVKTEADYAATRENIRNAVNPKEYEQWITDLFKGVIEKSGIRNNKDYFDYYGNARSWEALHWANNLSNVVRAMKQQNNGDVSFFSGLGIWGVSAKEYQSIDEIRADKDRLKSLPAEEYKAIKEGFGERLTEIATSIMSKSESNYFIALDNAMECIVDAVRSSKTKSGVLRNLKQYTQLSVTETAVSDIVSLVADISQMPTEYFEAKPQRAVGFEEVATAIIPSDSSAELKEALKKRGVPVKEYQQGNSEDRLKALHSIENVKFSERDSDGNTLTAEQQEFFKNSKVRDKNGNLLVVYHGTQKASFTTFNTELEGSYFTANPKYALEYARQNKDNVYSVYLNITKPFDTRNAEERKIFEEQFYGQWGNGAPLTDRGLLDWTDGADMYDFIQENGLDYDGIIIDEGGTPDGNGGVRDRGISYVAFNSNQIKNTTNKKPTSNPDIRYSERENLEDRVSGDNLLNAQDLIETVKSVSGIVDNYGYITLYHRTSKVNAEKIRNTGIMQGKEDGLFFSTSKDGQAKGYGDTVVEFLIPAEKLVLDDLFDKEAHLRLPIKNGRTMNVSEYLRDNRLRYEDLSAEDYARNSAIYSYDFLTSQSDMVSTKLPEIDLILGEDSNINKKIVAEQGLANATKEGEIVDGKVFVQNSYTKRKYRIDINSIRHGLSGDKNRLRTNSRMGAVIGTIVKNAIPINALKNEATDVVGTYAMAAHCFDSKNREFIAVVTVEERTGNIIDITSYDVVHSLSGRQKTRDKLVGTKPQGVYPSKPISGTISISELLNIVNSTHQSILSEDVLNALGEVRNPEGYYSNRVLFQDRDLDLLEQKQKVITVLAKETDKLKEDNQYLKELVKLQRKVTHGTLFTKSSVEIAAGRLLKSADARGNKSELVSLLNDFYGYIAKSDNLAWEDISEKAQPVIDWLKQNKVKRPVKLDAEASALLKELREKRIYLDKDQQSEAGYVYGSYYEFRKRTMGSLTIVDKNNPKGAKALESVWMELAERYPAYFDPDTISASMPARLLEIIEKLRNYQDDSTVYDYSEEMVNQNLLTQVYDSYWDVSTLHTVADSKQKEINLLKIKHRKKMTEVKEYHNEKHNQLKSEYKEKIARIKQDYRERNAQTTRELMNRYQESRKRAAENRDRTEMRHKIKKVVSDLNKLLLHGTKEKNIKLGLQEAVASALEAVNMDTVSAESRIAILTEELLKAKTPEKIEEIQHKIDYIKNMGDNLADRLEALRKAYDEIKSSSSNEDVSRYKEEASLIHERIKSVIKEVGKTPLRDMTLDQLNAVYDMYSMVLTTIRNANGVWRDGKLEDLQQNASAIMQDVASFKKSKNEEAKIVSDVKEFGWNAMTPYYAFERVGSKNLTKFYWDFVKGQNVYANDINEAKEFSSATRKKYNYNNWNLDKVYEYKCKDGRTFKTTLKHMLSIYAYSKREQAALHMEIGGFFHDDKSTFRKGKFGLELIRKDESGYKVDREMLEKIKADLSDSQLKYVDEMQEYLTKMGEKGNEVTRVIWGINIFKEKVYFPLKSKNDFIKRSNETAQSVSLKNDGMTKETVAGASNPIVLEAFDEVWASHIERMSQYHGFVIPIDNFNKVIQYGTWVGTDSLSVSTMLTGRFGSSATEYFTQFINDMNGNKANQGAKPPLVNFFTKFKKTAVGVSLSTVVQQPTAILRAMAEIDAKYFVGKPNTAKLSGTWGEIKKYAPVAIIKEVGGFDAGGGKQTVSWINSDTLRGKDKVMNTIDDVAMKGAEVADKLGWSAIWDAVKREVKANNPNLSSEEFLKKAGERFTEIIVKTQVYDSTLSRSGFMRSKNEYMKMLTAFMGEPTLSINMIFDSIIKAVRGDKSAKIKAVKTISFVYASMIAASVASSFVYALNDDDEDESYWEKFMQAFGGEVISDIVLAPITSLPAVKDIVSIFQGWDVERTDMSIFKDIYDAFTSLDSENKSVYRKIEDFAGAIGNAFGVPVKNLLRTGRQMYNSYKVIFDNISGGDIGGAFIEGITGDEKTKSEKLYYAVTHGDEARMQLYLKGKDKSEIDSALRKALRDNDPRIGKAAQAIIDGNPDERIRITRELIAEGHFSSSIIIGAINAELTYLKQKMKEEE